MPKTLEEALVIIAQQQDMIGQQQRENAELRAKLVAMDAQLRRLVRRAFRRSSEALIHDPGQQSIPEIAACVKALETAVEQAAADETPASEPATVNTEAVRTRPSRPTGKPRGRGRLTLPDHLEQVEDRVTLPDQALVQPDGTRLVPVGEIKTARLDWNPGHFIRRVTIRVRYGESDTRSPVITAPVPPCIVPKGLGGDALVIHIAHQKYGLGLPLFRQRRDWLRQGVDLSTQTVCSWFAHLAERLSGVAGAIRQQILDEPVLHIDDTPLRRFDLKRPGRCHTARMWCYTANQQVFFDFTDSREGRWPGDLLRGYGGTIVADAYGGHDRLFDLRQDGHAHEAGCWAHARRPFRENTGLDIAREVLWLIQGLYRIDDAAEVIAVARGSDLPTERLRLRRSQAPAILTAIEARAKSIVAGPVTQSALAEGAKYLLNHWTALNRFLEDGRIPLDNNAAERENRPVAVGRKNWLFVASEDGGMWASVLLGIFQSCRLQHIDPIDYLTDIMPACIAGDVDPLNLTPKAYAQRSVCASA